MRKFPVQPLLAPAAMVTALALTAPLHADDCYFSNLRWSSDGTHLLFSAGAGSDTRALSVEVSTGRLECEAPRVLDPTWSEASHRVLFRDRFGVFEVRPDEPQHRPRMLLFLPEMSHHFLRSFGEDARGRVLVWTYDRSVDQHAIWTLEPGPAQAAPRVSSGPEALHLWQSSNVARPFTDVGGRFVRSTCMRELGGSERLCVEQIPEAAPGALFRLTLGAPGSVRVLLPRCAPTAFAPAPDSSKVLLGLLEDVDDSGHGGTLSTWLVGWSDGKRLAGTPLAPLLEVRTRHDSWVCWLGSTRALWADAAGGLSLLELNAGAATTIVPGATAAAPADVYRVVALATADRAAADAAQKSLRSSGREAGIRSNGQQIEVQVAAFGQRADADVQAASLRTKGFTQAAVRTGGVQDVAAGISFAHASGPGARTACVRNVESENGRFSEIWIVPASGPERRLVGSFENFVPITPAP